MNEMMGEIEEIEDEPADRTKEIALSRIITWMRGHNIPSDDILDCIMYIISD